MTTIRHGVLGTAIVQAQHLADHGEHAQAAALLGAHLAAHQPETATTDPALIQAALLYALTEQNRPGRRLRWARYAVAASRRRYDPTDPRMLTAARVCAMVLRQQHHHIEAGRALAMLLAVCREHGMDGDALRVQIELAQCLHAQGHCGEGIRHAGQAWQQWRREHPTDVDDGTEILRAYATMLWGCDRITDVLDLATQSTGLHPVLRNVLGEPADPVALGRRLSNVNPAVHAPVCAARQNAALDTAALRTDATRRPPRP